QKNTDRAPRYVESQPEFVSLLPGYPEGIAIFFQIVGYGWRLYHRTRYIAHFFPRVGQHARPLLQTSHLPPSVPFLLRRLSSGWAHPQWRPRREAYQRVRIQSRFFLKFLPLRKQSVSD